MRLKALFPLMAGSLALSGCVASVAVGAIGAATRSSQKGNDAYHDDEAVKVAARTACSAQAAAHGDVHIIDSEQRSATKVTVWGIATSATERRSFDCRYDRKVVSFKTQKL